MDGHGRPPAVVRFLRRPLWWAAGATLVVAAFVIGDARIVAADDAPFRAPVIVDATVLRSSEDTDTVDVAFPWPIVGAPVVEATTYVHFVHAFPQPGDRVSIEVAADDPAHVRLAEDARSALQDLPFYLGLVVLPLAFLAGRRWHVRRAERLTRRPASSYAMVAAVDPPHGWHRRWRLFLYPVDAAPGDPPVGAAALITLPTLPGGTFPVEVKGSPRPYGRMVARAGGDLLWTRGRCLPRAALARPAQTCAWPADPRHLPVDVGGLAAVPSPWLRRSMVGAALVLVLVYIGWDHRIRLTNEERTERSRYVDATAHGPPEGTSGMIDPSGLATVVAFDVGGRQRDAVIVLDHEPVPGEVVGIRYLTDDPSQAWVADAPELNAPDVFVPMVSALGAAGLFVAAASRRRREDRIAAARGVLLDEGATTFPPSSARGLGVRDGRLRYPESDAIPVLDVAGSTLRFEEDGLVGVDPSGRARLLPWWSPSGPRGWWLDPTTHRHAAVLYAPEPAPLARGLPLSPAVVARSTLSSLVTFVETTPAARAGLADPVRTAAVIAHLAGADVDTTSASAFALLVDRDVGTDRADPPSAAPSG